MDMNRAASEPAPTVLRRALAPLTLTLDGEDDVVLLPVPVPVLVTLTEDAVVLNDAGEVVTTAGVEVVTTAGVVVLTAVTSVLAGVVTWICPSEYWLTGTPVMAEAVVTWSDAQGVVWPWI